MVLSFWCSVLVVITLCIGTAYPATREPSKCSHTPDLDDTTHVHIKNRDGSHVGRSKRDANTFSEMFSMEVVYDSSVNTGLNSVTRQQIQGKVIPKLKEFYEDSLAVRKLPGPLVFDRSCTGGQFFKFQNTEDKYCVSTCTVTTQCGNGILNIPDDYLSRCRECNGANTLDQCTESGSDGPGSNASFVLFVAAVTTGSCPTTANSGAGSTLAFAGSCRMEDDFDRPVAGYVNFCPFSINAGQSDNYLLTVTKHEILHALGFSSGLYRWWRDENGDPRSPRNSNGIPTETSTNTLRSVTYTDWSTANGAVSHTVSLLVTPNIVEEGRIHYNCSTLEGVQVEDQGGSGTVGSHWEARITKGEFMTGVIDNDAVFSRLTFALLQDSGWYQVNYTFADQLVWGRAGGCELAAGSCRGYINSQTANMESISPFCNYDRTPSNNADTLYRCTVGRTAVSNCNRVTFNSPLPSQYQYFAPGTLGGAFEFTDYCPYQVGFSNTICTDTGNNGVGLSGNSLAETYGPNSRCIEHGRPWTAQQDTQTARQTFTRAGCYEYECSNGQVIVNILGQSYTCTTAGVEIQVSLESSDGIMYTGSIICPSCLEICYDDFINCPEAALVYSEFAALVDIGSGDLPDFVTDPPTNRPTNRPTDATTEQPTRGGGDRDSGTQHNAAAMIIIVIFCVISFLFM